MNHNFVLIERPVSSASGLFNVARELFSKVDAVFTGMDNMVVENLDSVLKAGFEANKPVLAGDHGSVKRGALAAMGIDQTDIGKRTGYIADKVLRGTSPGNIPVYETNSGIPLINISTAKRLSIDIDKTVLQEVNIVE